MRGTLALLGALCAVPIVLSAGPASQPRAGTAVRMDVAELTLAADLVLEARVLSCTPLTDARGRIWTDYELAVDRTFEGVDAPRRTVRLPGGVLPSGRGLLVPGLPELLAGEQVVLFLSPPSPNGARVPCGLAQGKYAIVRDRAGQRHAVRGHAGLSVVGSGAHSTRAGRGIAVVDYAELVAGIESAVNAKRARGGDR